MRHCLPFNSGSGERLSTVICRHGDPMPLARRAAAPSDDHISAVPQCQGYGLSFLTNPDSAKSNSKKIDIDIPKTGDIEYLQNPRNHSARTVSAFFTGD